ncbi:SET domain-containing protein [Podospora conica]|nr:SET domain-containing protein [Schizothecium conicum]
MSSSLLLLLSLAAVRGGTFDGYPKAHTILARSTCTNNPAGPLNPLPHQTTCPPAVDDKTPPSKQKPWSFPPICVTSLDPAVTSKLCTFTVTTLRGGPGMSIITTPSVAAQLSATLQDPDVAWLEKQRQSRLASSPPHPYSVQEIPGKALGMVATRAIRAGETVLAELPVMIKIGDPGPWNRDAAVPVMIQAAKRLPAADQARLLQMARQGGDRFIIDDIFITNGFFVSVAGVDHTGVFPEAARLNHNCKPNCITRFSQRTLALEVVAYRDIAPGEELTHSYLPLNLPSLTRTSRMKNWGFTCTCPLCTAPIRERAESDVRRQRVDKILGGGNVSDDMRGAMAELEALARAEGLMAQLGDFWRILAEKGADKNAEAAREVAGAALGVMRRYAGWDSVRAGRVEGLVERLRKT